MAWPTGTITFLFTDIEGSTHLWERHPGPMQRALRRHDVLVREALDAHGGTLVKSTGDGVIAAFAQARDAVMAAVRLQQTIAGELWEPETPLRIRAALHTGEAEMRDQDYFGQTLNRTARLMAVGHGAQILVSQAVHDQIGDPPSPEVGLRDLGLHRLKDLAQPTQVFQVLHPDLPADFPALMSLNNTPNNLPQQISSFVGRTRETAEIKGLLKTARLVTLTGSGGSGKTRLSLQIAAEVLESYPDGAWFVELASLTSPELVAKAVAAALDIREVAGQEMLTTVADALKDKRLLLILDNCEHLVGAAAQMAATLTQSCARVVVLASSRERLNLPGERAYQVPSLPLPEPGHAPTPEGLLAYAGVQLFVDRAQHHRPDFVVTQTNAPTLASICRRLDGIPLALELAAARTRVLSVDELDSRLDNRFRLLTGGNRTALPRQQTLRALIDWSYDLLNDPERVLLHRLSVFSGGWGLDAAEAVCVGEPIEDWEMLDLLTSLSDKSLVLCDEADGQVRYRMLESVRQYALEHLELTLEATAVRRRHGMWMVDLAEEGATKLHGAEQVLWHARLETEQNNLRAALDFFRDDPDGGVCALRLTAAMQLFWPYHGHFAEGKRRYAEVLGRDLPPEAAQSDIATQARSASLIGAGNIAYLQSDYPTARQHYEQAREIHERTQNAAGLAAVLGSLGNVAQYQGDFDQARHLFEQALEMNRQMGNRAGEARNLTCLCSIASDLGDNEAALGYIEAAVALHHAQGDVLSEGTSRSWQGVVLTSLGRYGAARQTLNQARALAESVGNQVTVASVLGNLGNVAFASGDMDEARRLYAEAGAIYAHHGNRRNVYLVLYESSAVLYQEGDLTGFVRLLAAASAIRAALGGTLSTQNAARFEAMHDAARTALGDAAFESAWTEGSALSMEDALAQVGPRPS